MDKLQLDLFRHYNQGFNDGLYHATDFMKSVADDLAKFPEGESDGQVLLEVADVLLEDIKKEHEND
jgi:hypothetical protein